MVRRNQHFRVARPVSPCWCAFPDQLLERVGAVHLVIGRCCSAIIQENLKPALEPHWAIPRDHLDKLLHEVTVKLDLRRQNKEKLGPIRLKQLLMEYRVTDRVRPA